MIKKSLVDLEIKGKPNPENQDLMESNKRYSLSDGDKGGEDEPGLGYNYQIDRDKFDGEVIMHEDVIYACNESTDNLIKFSKNNKSTIVSNNKKINDNWNGIDEDLRYSSIVHGAKKIVLENFYSTDEDYKIFLKNAERNSFPITKITIIDNRKIINSLSNYCYFKKLENSIEEINENLFKIKIKKDATDKVAFVSINNHNFICDIAENYQDKITGLQDRDLLEPNSGMLFSYDKPSDLYFHMGAVKFAIDILFIDENNKILKIYNNIKPRTLGTFGCKNSKSVLEVVGGFCEKNKISEGDYVQASKLSSLGPDDLRHALNPINKSFSKIAKLSKYDSELYKTVLAINEKTMFPKDSTYFYFNDAKIKWDSLKLFHISDIKYKNIKIASFDMSKINRDSIEYPFVEKIVIYGNLDNTLVNRVSISKIFDSFSLKNIDFEIVKINDCDHSNVSKIIKNKYGSEKVFFINGPLYKTANFPVSESVRELARKADERLLICSKKLNNIISDLETNVSAYNAYKDNHEVIISSKAQFHLSMKKIIEKYESMLDTVKAAMTILYKIKDASQIEDLIKGLSQSAATLSEALTTIFNLVDKMEDLEFFNDLVENTDKFKNLCKDSEFSIKGCREFIHSHILGILILA